MAVRRSKEWHKARYKYNGTVESALWVSGQILRREMQAVLSQDGTGRFYARTKAARRFSDNPFTREISGAALSAAVLFEAARVAGTGKVARSLRKMGIHQASAPGMPPAKYNGRLVKSVRVDGKNIKAGRVRVGPMAPHAKLLEFGRKNAAPRPFMRVSLMRAVPLIRRALHRGFGKIRMGKAA